MTSRARKFGRFALAVSALLLVGTLAACGGGDDDNEYDFNGTWGLDGTVTQSNVPGIPQKFLDSAVIDQAGTDITVQIPGIGIMVGTCDPGAGTFRVMGSTGTVAHTLDMTAVDNDTMTGEMVMASGPRFIRWAVIAQLVSRSKAAAPATGGAFEAAVKKLL